MCLMIRQLGCFFKKTQMLRIKFFLIRSFSNSALETSVILRSTRPLWPVSFSSFSTNITLQVPNKIITKIVGAFWVQV